MVKVHNIMGIGLSTISAGGRTFYITNVGFKSVSSPFIAFEIPLFEPSVMRFGVCSLFLRIFVWHERIITQYIVITLVPRVGFEPTTLSLEHSCSVQLSYRGLVLRPCSGSFILDRELVEWCGWRESNPRFQLG